jgi:toxin-antitoxin system PIN domain toxin
VIAIDTNILVYAHRADSTFHARAGARVREVAEGNASWAIAWPCVHEFFAIVTHPRIYAPPSPIGKALDQLDAWMESPTLSLLSESELYWPVLRRTLDASQVQGARTHDARIAALCVAHGVSELWSADRDFSRFGELRVVNPLVT